MIARLTFISLCMIGLAGILFIISGAGLLLELATAIIGFITSFSLVKKK